MNGVLVICGVGAALTAAGIYFATSPAEKRQWAQAHAAFLGVGLVTKVLVEVTRA